MLTMKNKKSKFIIATCLLISVLSSCCMNKEKNFIGYIVAKEYTPAHMSNEAGRTISYALIVPYIPPSPKPHQIESKFIWYVANKYEVLAFSVDTAKFNAKILGEKVTLKRTL